MTACSGTTATAASSTWSGPSGQGGVRHRVARRRLRHPWHRLFPQHWQALRHRRARRQHGARRQWRRPQRHGRAQCGHWPAQGETGLLCSCTPLGAEGPSRVGALRWGRHQRRARQRHAWALFHWRVFDVDSTLGTGSAFCAGEFSSTGTGWLYGTTEHDGTGDDSHVLDEYDFLIGLDGGATELLCTCAPP